MMRKKIGFDTLHHVELMSTSLFAVIIGCPHFAIPTNQFFLIYFFFFCSLVLCVCVCSEFSHFRFEKYSTFAFFCAMLLVLTVTLWRKKARVKQMKTLTLPLSLTTRCFKQLKIPTSAIKQFSYRLSKYHYSVCLSLSLCLQFTVSPPNCSLEN